MSMGGAERWGLQYDFVKDLGSGNFGVAKLMRNKITGVTVAIKYIERGERIDKNVEREIINHRTLNHPNIIAFKELFLTPSHLGIAMEYASGGELFERIVKAGKFSEDEARYFFQQLLSGVDYCHQSGVCHRDLKLENTLLDGNPAPRLKICDFGYSKSALDSQPKSTVGTPAYIAPEVLQRKEYNGQTADVWSCGVTLFVMLVGAYPFEDPADPRNFRKTIQRIMGVKYAFPANQRISPECLDLVARIFNADPIGRITMADIRRHPWFLKNLPAELSTLHAHPRARPRAVLLPPPLSPPGGGRAGRPVVSEGPGRPLHRDLEVFKTNCLVRRASERRASERRASERRASQHRASERRASELAAVGTPPPCVRVQSQQHPRHPEPHQSIEEIRAIIQAARNNTSLGVGGPSVAPGLGLPPPKPSPADFDEDEAYMVRACGREGVRG
ncbi:MAG: hypothetical protein WDW38_005127 [Sanguina aurantia]